MRKRLAALALGLGLLASPILGATASAQEPPDPADPNCHGQAVKFILGLGQEAEPPIHGLGNIAKFLGISVKDVQDLIQEFCADTP